MRVMAVIWLALALIIALTADGDTLRQLLALGFIAIGHLALILAHLGYLTHRFRDE